MRERISQYYRDSRLATKIRYSYLLLLIPLFTLLMFCLYHLWVGNRNYENMLNSSIEASEFSLDFKKDFDYETYLLITGNRTRENTKLHTMLSRATEIVSALEYQTADEENLQRLKCVGKYLNNLSVYVERIEENLKVGSLYEVNMEIWENDIQIVTTLVQDTIYQYTYYEIRGIQKFRDEYRSSYLVVIRFLLIAVIVIFIAVIVLSLVIPLSITRPITQLCSVMDRVAGGDLKVRADFNNGAEVMKLSNSLNTMIDKINELLTQVTNEQICLRKAEFELLQSQINPHFLYNTLDAIVWLAESGEQKRVVRMVGNLSDFFRISLNQGRDIVTIKDELAHVRSYLEIQKVRYQDILAFHIDVDEALYPYLIPKITIQPLVENALYHGIKNKRGQGKIEITGKKQETGECMLLCVEDDGIGITAEWLEHLKNALEHRVTGETSAYGLYNVNQRIRLNFGEEYGIKIESTEGVGTRVKIVLPCRKTDQE